MCYNGRDEQARQSLLGADALCAMSELDGRTRTLLMCIRQAIIMALGAIEDYLGLQRSITPKRKR